RLGALLALHSFPTRRSSDLDRVFVNQLFLTIGFEQNGEVVKRFDVSSQLEAIRQKDGNRDALFSQNVQVMVLDINRLGHTSSSLDRKSTRLNSSHVKISYAV